MRDCLYMIYDFSQDVITCLPNQLDEGNCSTDFSLKQSFPHSHHRDAFEK